MARNTERLDRQNVTKVKQIAAANPLWRMQQFFRIVNKDSQLVPYQPNNVQQLLHENLSNHKDRTSKDIILKARQVGLTTDRILSGFDKVLWNPRFTYEFISLDEDTMRKTFDKIKVAWANFPLKELFKVERMTQDEIRFTHGSVARVAMKSRGGTVNYLHVSELGKIACSEPLKAKEIITGAFPAVPPSGRIVIESTAEGEGNIFHKLWKNANNGKNDFKPHFFPWFFIPEYRIATEPFELTKQEVALVNEVKLRYDYDLGYDQILFYRNQEGVLGDLVKQEYVTFAEEAFLSSGRPVFDHKTIKLSCKEKDPVKEHTYVLGLDVADIGEDKCVMKVMDCNTGEIVYNFEDDMLVEDFTDKAIEIGTKYNYALIGWEMNGVGTAVRGRLLDANYPNIYTSISKDKITDTFSEKVGVSMTRQFKRQIITDLRHSLSTEEIHLSDEKDLSQLREFQAKDNGKLEAPTGEHDDRVMALAIANYLYLNYPLNAIEVSKPKMSKLGELSKGLQKLSSNTPYYD